jgi:NAD(P)-dependent dehydrogenase (short-subunit alcohol dehydrogenase family)
MTDQGSKVWMITGCSSGIGKETAAAALRQGDRVVATARNPRTLEDLVAVNPGSVLVRRLDVSESGGAEHVVAAALEWAGRLDVVMNNAGYGYMGALEEQSLEQVRAMFDVNFFGALQVLSATVPVLRRQRAGHVIMVSSKGAVMANPGVSTYAATKAALESVAEALATEMRPFGVKVTIIQPGSCRTGFLDSALRWASPIDEYEVVLGAVRQGQASHNGTQPGDPVRLAEAIIRITRADQPPLRLPLGSDALAVYEARQRIVADELAAWGHLADISFEEAAGTDAKALARDRRGS